MPSILSDEDKETVKRTVPKQTNKIQAVAVARLYVAFPNRSKWTYTGLQGAIVLANDLVGNTYWLKLVDISPSARGVIWDQEIFDIWSYNQDRTFFHTFELEECLAGLSFVDEKEAKQFKKKMDEREKNASKATRNTPFGGSNHAQPAKHGGLFGGIFGGHRHSSAPSPPESPRNGGGLPPPPPAPASTHSRSPSTSANGVHKPASEFATLEAYDPLWRENFGNFLTEQGLTDEFIKENQEFIVGFLQEQGGEVPKSAPAPPPPPPPVNGHSTGHGRAPPPPPPPPSSSRPPAPDSTSSAGSRRGMPPPPARTTQIGQNRCRYARTYTSARFNTPSTARSASAAPAPGPPPPPRPPKTPVDGHEDSSHKFGRPGAAPASARHAFRSLTSTITAAKGTRLKRTSGAALIIKTCSGTPTKECTRSSTCPGFGRTSAAALAEHECTTTSFAEYKCTTTTPSAELKRTTAAASSELRRAATAAAASDAGCVWSYVWRTPTTSSTSAPARGGYGSGVPAAAIPKPDSSRSAMLGDIQKAGGIAALKKVDRSQIRDRSAATVGGSGDTGGSGAPAAGASSGGGGMADALAAALQKRKQKVSDSDDEDNDDEW
ncbi:hypothetical protein PG997_004916 [Apiospora hydei]|uniref:WH1 domain-containing protein n=1 Tax=Apiospora hydei TaxID=1337664 RepID=A0ABR1X3G8_9PEZI